MDYRGKYRLDKKHDNFVKNIKINLFQIIETAFFCNRFIDGVNGDMKIISLTVKDARKKTNLREKSAVGTPNREKLKEEKNFFCYSLPL